MQKIFTNIEQIVFYQIMEYKVFNIEFEGIDKCGKDYMVQYFLKVRPNIYTPKARGILSQLVYTKMYGRNDDYKVNQGYLDNTLFVYLKVDKADWEVRCKLENEPMTDYDKSVEAFDNGFDDLYNKVSDKRQILVLNTSALTPYQIVNFVCRRLDELNA